MGGIVALGSSCCAVVERVQGWGGEGAEGQVEELSLESKMVWGEAGLESECLACS